MSSRVASLSLRSLAIVISLIAVTAPAWSASVTQVRIGNHPTFTRVVFELDAAAGYGIETTTTEAGKPEILVTLQAGSTPRSINSRSEMVEQVTVQEGRSEAVVRIRLNKQPSRVKELILADPPRIVFDFVFPESRLAAIRAEAERKAAATPPAPMPQPDTRATALIAEQPSAEQKAATEAAAKADRLATAEAEKKAATEAKAEAERMAKLEAEKKVAAAAAAKADRLATAEAEKKAATEAKAERIAKLEAEKKKAEADERARQREAERVAQLPVKPGPSDPDLEPPSFEGGPIVEAPKPGAVAQRTPAPAPASTGGDDGSIDWVTYGAAGAGVILLFVGLVLFLRRRKLPNDMDVTALAEEEGLDGGEKESAIPTGEFSMGNVGASNVSPGSTAVVGSVDLSSVEVPAPDSGPSIVAGPGLLDDEPEKESKNMVDLESGNLPVDRTQSEIPTQIGGTDPHGSPAGGAGDVARLVQELERRVAQMETRLDESIDARERLERQVAAQSEELRVQRAAIARTQRALRTLNRSEDEQATEPALREPSKPVGE